jgi:hypothetical protein
VGYGYSAPAGASENSGACFVFTPPSGFAARRPAVVKLLLHAPHFNALINRRQRFSPASAMKTDRRLEYCLIVEGAYLNDSEAEHALRDPFIEDWVEQNGRFRLHNLGEIELTPSVPLGNLGIVMLDERLFEIASCDPERPLTEHQAKGVAEALRRQDMFDEISVEPREDDEEEEFD